MSIIEILLDVPQTLTIDHHRYERRLGEIVDGKRIDERARESYDPFVHGLSDGFAGIVETEVLDGFSVSACKLPPLLFSSRRPIALRPEAG